MLQKKAVLFQYVSLSNKKQFGLDFDKPQNMSDWYRHPMDPSPDQYGYSGEGGRQQQQHQTNPRQKNAMTAAV